ncbi:MAG: Lipid-A-disaccharide synthase [Syntrophorhabdus sp. PtaU1.Bin050]|nr:MAG: Lipid-A-disaccharide synthase [Syntrophorhabdus sp. PtaU1.Bin050]
MQKNNSNRQYNGKIVIVTGELSGEIHASHLVQALQGSLNAKFSGMGSTKLQEVGVRIIVDYRGISITGLSEVLWKLKYIRQAYNALRDHIRREQPSLLVLVDFPGFNLKIARFAKALGVPVIYFIPPQIWAWRKSRIKKIRDRVNKVICVLPFEKVLYDKNGVDAAYVGHPFMNTVKPLYSRVEFLDKMGINREGPIITIMPGSRENEVRKHMPTLLAVIASLEQRIGKLTVLLPLAENIDSRLVQSYLKGQPSIKAFKGLSYDALSSSDLAFIASGSATLEAAILGIPTIVIYKVSSLSYFLARMLVKVNYISLPNIIAGKEVFPEFIQHLNPENIAEKAAYMLNNGRDCVKADIEAIKVRLGRFDSYRMAKDEITGYLEHLYGTLPKTS